MVGWLYVWFSLERDHQRTRLVKGRSFGLYIPAHIQYKEREREWNIKKGCYESRSAMSQNNGLEISADKPWVYLDVAVGLETYVTDFRTHLEPRVRPEWSSKELGVKLFDSGITNTLVAIFLKDRGLANSRDDVVLLRMNGVGSEKIIDRTDELHCMHLLHREGIGPPVYAQLKNGLCYGFLPGRQMRLEEVREEGVAKKVAMVMSSLHGVEIPEHFQGRKPQLWAKVRVGHNGE